MCAGLVRFHQLRLEVEPACIHVYEIVIKLWRDPLSQDHDGIWLFSNRVVIDTILLVKFLFAQCRRFLGEEKQLRFRGGFLWRPAAELLIDMT